MRLWMNRRGTRLPGRRNVMLMTFWYFAVIFSAFLYYTYAIWRPAYMYSALFDGPMVGPGAVRLQDSEDTLGPQKAELRRILGMNGSLSGKRGDGALSNLGQIELNNSRTRNDTTLKGGYRDQVTNETRVRRRVEAENEDEMTEIDPGDGVDEENRSDLTTVRFENSTVKSFVAPVVEGYERTSTREALRLHCGRCAVVSSSGHLINQSRGQDIDSAQCVLRMNSAPTVGYEDDVGARTTVRVIGHVNMPVLNSNLEYQQEIFINQTSRAEKIIIPWLHPVRSLETNRHYKIAQNLSEKFSDVEFYILTQEKTKLAEEVFKSETGISTREAKTWLTTGWMTILFAIDVCDEIDIYGLVDESHCRDHPNDTTPYHYYDPKGKRECAYYQRSEERLTSGHLFITEKAVFARWAHRFNLHFHSPAWNLTANSAANMSLALETPFLKRFYEAKRKNVSTPVRTRKVVRRVVRRVVVKKKAKKV